MPQLRHVLVIAVIVTISLVPACLPTAIASAQQPPPGPQTDAVGVEGRVASDPPSQAATIVSPANGQAFTTLPITVTGTCPANTLVKIFSNNIFIGSVDCQRGSYTLQVSLFGGRNDLVAKVFDALDQPGPDSRTVTVTYTDPQFAQFSNQLLLTSQYARRAADPGNALEWPLILSGGIGPYAFSIDWGDGTPAELISQQFAGVVILNHRYESPGIYHVIVRVADKNGATSFLQVVALSNGEAGGTGTTSDKTDSDPETIIVPKILWQPLIGMLLLIPLGFWLGRRAALTALRKRLEREYRQS